MYATVILKAEQRPRALAIPIEAVPPGSTTVYVVNARNEVTERQVKFGIETATKYEVLSGLAAGDLVMMGNPMQLKAGQKVEAQLNTPLEKP
jgi:multidrug efflux pump subunit AcrA (membrane-fusion protein)